MKNILASKKRIKNEVPESKHIPLIRHASDSVVVTENHEYFFTLKVSGLSYETIDDDLLDIKAEARNLYVSSLENHNVCIYSHVIRRNIQVENEGEYPKGFLSHLDHVYNKKFENKSFSINEIYLTVLLQPNGSLLKKIQSKRQSKSLSVLHEEKILNTVDDLITRTKGVFTEYDVSILGIRTENSKRGISIHYSEVLEFISKFVNLADYKIRLPEGKLCDYVSVNRKVFGYRNIEVQINNRKKYGALVSIKNYCPETYAGILDCLYPLNCEFVLTQTFKTQNRTNSIEFINKTKRLMHDGDHAKSLAAELEYLTDDISSNALSLGESHFSLFLYSDTKEKLNDITGKADSELTNVGITAVVDNLNLECAFWAQIPGNLNYIARKVRLTSYNFAHFTSMHNLPLGKSHGNKWGRETAILTTANNTPYYFNWHYKDFGLTTIIGPPGSGKTVVALQLIAESMKVKPSVYLFDKDRGAEIFVRACGGTYSNIKYGERTGWNPLALDLNDKSNRSFLYEFLKFLLTDQEPLNAEEKASVHDLVNVASDLPVNKRTLRNLESYIYSTLSRHIHSFKRWITDSTGRKGEYYWCFDNDIDDLSIEGKKIYGFDMTEFLDIPEIRPVILSYLFKRIENSLDGSPTIIYVDECQKATEDKYFRKALENYALTIRKRNGIVAMATQQAKKMNVNDAFVEMSQNQIFFANPKAKKDDYSTFALGDRELDIIKNMPQNSGWFLLKRADGSLIARADLTGCDDELAVLSARKETLELMDELIAKYGEAPNKWLHKFYEQWRDHVKKRN